MSMMILESAIATAFAKPLCICNVETPRIVKIIITTISLTNVRINIAPECKIFLFNAPSNVKHINKVIYTKNVIDKIDGQTTCANLVYSSANDTTISIITKILAKTVLLILKHFLAAYNQIKGSSINDRTNNTLFMKSPPYQIRFLFLIYHDINILCSAIFIFNILYIHCCEI